MTRHLVGVLAIAAMGAGLAGCGRSGAKAEPPLTERQRDSLIATEKALPGSGVVGRALAASDSAAAAAKRMDQQAEGGDDASGGK